MGNSIEQAVVIGIIGVLLAMCLVSLLIVNIGLMGMYRKAGKRGFLVWIPFVSTWVLYDIVYGKGYIMFLQLIPGVNIFLLFLLHGDIARAYGKSSLAGILLGLFPVIAYPIYGFSKGIQYVGPNGITQSSGIEDSTFTGF